MTGCQGAPRLLVAPLKGACIKLECSRRRCCVEGGGNRHQGGHSRSAPTIGLDWREAAKALSVDLLFPLALGAEGGEGPRKKTQSDPIQWKGVEARGNESASGGATLDEGPLAWVPSDRQGIFSPSSATAKYW